MVKGVVDFVIVQKLQKHSLAHPLGGEEAGKPDEGLVAEESVLEVVEKLLGDARVLIEVKRQLLQHRLREYLLKQSVHQLVYLVVEQLSRVLFKSEKVEQVHRHYRQNTGVTE